MPSVDIVARLKLKADEFRAEQEKAFGGLEARANRAAKMAGGVLSGIGIGSLAGLAAAGKQALDYASALGETSQQLGVSTRDLQIYSFAASQTGIKQEEMEKSLSKLTLQLGKAATGGAEQARAFKSLGINIRDSSGQIKSAGAVLPELADAYVKAGNSATGAAASALLLGDKVGNKMAPLLAMGSDGVKGLRNEAEELGLVLSDKAIKAADEAADKFGKLQKTLSVNFARTVAENADSIVTLANSFTTAASGLAKWWAQNPEKAMAISGGYLGASIGARVAGIPGAVAGAMIGAAAGDNAGRNMRRAEADGSTDLKFRRKELDKALRQYRQAKPDDDGSLIRVRREGDLTFSEATKNLEKQIALHKQAVRLFGIPTNGLAPPVASGADYGNLNATPGGRGGNAERARTNEQIFRDFEAALSKRGIARGGGRTGFRTAADQHEINQRGESPLDGYRRPSRHQNWQALDPSRASHNEQAAHAAAREAGLKDFKIVSESGGRKHYQWKGAGKPGDISSALDEEERLADKREAAAEVSKKAADELNKRYADASREMKTQLAMAEMRAAGLGNEAERLEAIAAIQGRFPELVGSTIQKDKERLAVLEASAVALVSQRQATEQRVISERNLEDFRKKGAEYEEKAAEEAKKLWDEQAERQRESVSELADFFEDAFDSGGKSIWDSFKQNGKRALAEMAAQWALSLITGQQQMGGGNILGQINGGSGGGGGLLGALGSLFGGGSQGGGRGGGVSVPGFGGSMTDDWFTRATGGLGGGVPGGGIGGGLPGAAGAGGGMSGAMGAFGMAVAANQIVGDIFGFKGGPLGVLTGLFTKTKKGSASLAFDKYGDLGVGRTTGNSADRKAAGSQAVGGIADTLSRIADQLGGTLGGTPSVSIGVRKDSFRVDTTGKGRTKGKGVLDFGKDQEAAIRAAISEALKDGVVQGISDASKRILQSGQELERAIEKAAMIEDIPRQLKARMDPVGAALDELNKRWDKTVAALKEGSASASQMADAQKLYKLELEDTKASAAEASASLKAFLDSLGFGSSSPYSLRDQESKAMAALQPYLDKIDAGQSIDQGKYQEAAQAYLDVERQLNGSTGAFFAAMDRVQGATGKAIATIDNAVPIRTASDPFAEKTAGATTATAEILAQHSGQLSNVEKLLTHILGKMGDGGGGFIGSGRGFVTKHAA